MKLRILPLQNSYFNEGKGKKNAKSGRKKTFYGTYPLSRGKGGGVVEEKLHIESSDF